MQQAQWAVAWSAMSNSGRQNLRVVNQNNETKKKEKWALPPARGAKDGPRRMACLINPALNLAFENETKMTYCEEYAHSLASFF